jgi:serine/threonine protein kinase
MRTVRRYEIRRGPEWFLWRVEEPDSRRLFTVKQVAATGPEGDRLLARLEEEYTLLNGLHHPHLLRPVRLDRGGRRAFFEDTQGSLAQLLLAHGTFSPTVVANVLLQCATALEQLHGRKKGHGSLSPHCILVGPQGEVKLGDFLGYDFAGGTGPLPPHFEMRYQAPELLDSSQGGCGPASDLYCLGYAALEMLTGAGFAALFGLGQDANWLGWHADPARTLEDWRGALFQVPEGLLDLIAGLIEKDPAKRPYRSAAQLKAALERSRLTSGQGLPPFPRAKTAPESQHPAPRRARPAHPLLVFPATDGPPRKFAPAQPVVVGRGGDCGLRLKGATVAGKHALLCEAAGHWWVHDLGSRTGTWVNGKRTTRARLRDGDEVSFGDERCRVRLGVPRVVGGFELTGALHQGAHGKLFRARWVKKDGRTAALRVLPRTFKLDEERLKRFVRGLPEAARISHPNVVQLYRGGSLRKQDGHLWFLAMEYLPGGSLRDRLRAGPRPAAEVIRCGLEIASALKMAARRNLTHGSINPSCILFDAAGSAKLGDFSLLGGVASALQELTQATQAPADRVYQAPEQVLGGDLGPACDLYSLVATLYEAATGQPPFPRDLSGLELVRAICTRPVRPAREVNPAVPPALADVLARGLDRCPQRRFTTPAELRAALRAAAATLRGTPARP